MSTLIEEELNTTFEVDYESDYNSDYNSEEELPNPLDEFMLFEYMKSPNLDDNYDSDIDTVIVDYADE